MYIEMWIINVLVSVFVLETILKIVSKVLDYRVKKYDATNESD